MDYCYHCVAEIDEPENPYCPQCGKEYNVYYSQSFEIPAGTYLCDNRYFVGKSLGSGGFGITYLGFDVKINKKIVIKETFYNGIFRRNSQNITLSDPLRVEYDSTISLDEIMSKTQKECFCLSRAESFNNIVKVYDWFAENNTAYIITEYINGDTLFDRVVKNGVYTWEELYLKFKPLLQSLSQLHKMDLLHRDIKPHNIMLRNVFKSKEDFVLIDFGLARSNQKSTLATVAAFTPGYSPFEQRTLTKKDGTYTDVYALGATMYYALTGETPNDEVVGDVHDNFPRLRDLRSSGTISEQVYNAFVSALQPNFRNRCQTIDEFIDELEGGAEYQTPVESPFNRKSTSSTSRETQYASANSPYEEEIFSEPLDSGARTSYASPQNNVRQNYISYQPQPQVQQSAPIYVSVQQPPNNKKHSGLSNFILFLFMVILLAAVIALLDALDIISQPDFLPPDYEDSEVVVTDYDNDTDSEDLGDDIIIENYIGRNFEEVKAELEEKGFTVTYRTEVDSSVDEGTILNQTDNPGEKKEIGGNFNFTVSKKGSTSSAAVSSSAASSAVVSSKLSVNSGGSGGSVSSAAVSSVKESVSSVAVQSTVSVATESVAEVVSEDEDFYDDTNLDLTSTYTRKFFTKPSTYSSKLDDEYGANGRLYTYGADNILYENDGTCWCEGVDGVGKGEWFQYNNNTDIPISQCGIINGYNKDKTTFNNNGRLTKIRFEFSDGTAEEADIDPNTMAEQTFYFGRVVYTSYLRVVIVDAVSGDKYDDTCISFIHPR